MNKLKLHLVLLCITSMLLLISTAGAAYDVVSNISSSSTEYTTSASYGELHNISLATGTGTTFLAASWDARVNFTAPLYGRFMRDGVSFGRFNLTQNVYATVGSYQISFAETTGTHYYGWEVYSNKKGTIYSRNFSAFFLVNGSYGVSSTYNSTYAAYQALITALQSNDTVDRAYMNNTFLPIATYSGDYPNSTLVNYLPISTYSGNFPNNTVAANLVNWNATFNSSYNALLTNAPNTTVAGNLANWNSTYNTTYDAKMSNPATADLDMGNYNITGLGQNESYSYLIWTDGTNYYAKNGSTGKVDYSGTNGNQLFYNVFNATISGGTVKISVGNFNLTGTEIKISKQIKIEGSGFGTQLYQGSNNTLFNFTSWGNTIQDINIGLNSYQSGNSGILLYNSHFNTLKDIYIKGGYYGIYLHGSLGNSLTNIIMTDNLGFYATTNDAQYRIYSDDFGIYAGNANQYTNIQIAGGNNGIYISGDNEEGNININGGYIEILDGVGLTLKNTNTPSNLNGMHFETGNEDILIDNSHSVVLNNIFSLNNVRVMNTPVTIIGGAFENVYIYANASLTQVGSPRYGVSMGGKLYDYSDSSTFYTEDVSKNGGFEYWDNSVPNYFTSYGATSITKTGIGQADTTVYAGKYAMKVSTSADYAGVKYSVSKEMAMDGFTVSGVMNITSGIVQVWMWVDNGAWATATRVYYASESTGWQSFLMDFYAPDGYGAYTILFQVASGGTAYFDNIKIFPKNKLTNMSITLPQVDSDPIIGNILFNTSGNIAQIYTGSAWNWFLMPSKVFGDGVTNNNNGSITISSILPQCPSSLVNGSMCLNYTTGAQNNYFDGYWRYTNGTVLS